MNRMIRVVALTAACVGVALVRCPTAAIAAEGREGPSERFERMERRLDQIAAQQEQLLRQIRTQTERQEQRFNQMTDRREQFMRQREGQGGRPAPKMQGPPGEMRPPLAPPHAMRPPIAPEGAPPLARPWKGLHDALGLFVLGWIGCNVLLAIWIFSDIRKRGEGPAIFVAMALIAGIPAAVIYSLVRIGDGRVLASGSAGTSGPEGGGSGTSAPAAG